MTTSTSSGSSSSNYPYYGPYRHNHNALYLGVDNGTATLDDADLEHISNFFKSIENITETRFRDMTATAWSALKTHLREMKQFIEVNRSGGMNSSVKSEDTADLDYEVEENEEHDC